MNGQIRGAGIGGGHPAGHRLLAGFPARQHAAHLGRSVVLAEAGKGFHLLLPGHQQDLVHPLCRLKGEQGADDDRNAAQGNGLLGHAHPGGAARSHKDGRGKRPLILRQSCMPPVLCIRGIIAHFWSKGKIAAFAPRNRRRNGQDGAKRRNASLRENRSNREIIASPFHFSRFFP